jgi:hypothetical protein
MTPQPTLTATPYSTDGGQFVWYKNAAPAVQSTNTCVLNSLARATGFSIPQLQSMMHDELDKVLAEHYGDLPDSAKEGFHETYVEEPPYLSPLAYMAMEQAGKNVHQISLEEASELPPGEYSAVMARGVHVETAIEVKKLGNGQYQVTKHDSMTGQVDHEIYDGGHIFLISDGPENEAWDRELLEKMEVEYNRNRAVN